MAAKKPENMSFEESLSELEAIVKHMESGELSLDQSLQQYERGVQLARVGQQKLNAAQQKVAILSGEGEQAALIPVDPDTLG